MKPCWLKALLIFSVCALVLQLLGTRLYLWWQLPRPGAIGVNYLSDNKMPSLAPGYVCLLPTKYEQAQKWPMILFLHGSGQRGSDPQIMIKWLGLHSLPSSVRAKAIILLPECRQQQYWIPSDISRLIEHARDQYSVDERRIYLIGYSMGAFGTWDTGAMYPEMFAAIVPISGGEYSKKLEALNKLPIWVFHGGRDDIVPVSQVQKIVDRLRASGGAAKVTIFPESDHGIVNQVWKLSALWRWLFSQRRKNQRLDAALGPINTNES